MTRYINTFVVHYDSSNTGSMKLNEAFRLILNGAVLIAIHAAKYYAVASGQLSLGPGAFVAALEIATGSTAEVIG